jgi:hypothetical protein
LHGGRPVVAEVANRRYPAFVLQFIHGVVVPDRRLAEHRIPRRISILQSHEN